MILAMLPHESHTNLGELRMKFKKEPVDSLPFI